MRPRKLLQHRWVYAYSQGHGRNLFTRYSTSISSFRFQKFLYWVLGIRHWVARKLRERIGYLIGISMGIDIGIGIALGLDKAAWIEWVGTGLGRDFGYRGLRFSHFAISGFTTVQYNSFHNTRIIRIMSITPFFPFFEIGGL